ATGCALPTSGVGTVVADCRGVLVDGCDRAGARLSRKQPLLGWRVWQLVDRAADSAAGLAGAGDPEAVAFRQLADPRSDGAGMGRRYRRLFCRQVVWSTQVGAGGQSGQKLGGACWWFVDQSGPYLGGRSLSRLEPPGTGAGP